MAPQARTTDPQTSHDAAASVTNVSDTQKLILTLLHDAGRGFTAPALCQRYHHTFGNHKASDASIRSRLKELHDLGFVRVAAKERLASGRQARVMALTEAGKSYIESHPA